ncbi:MAG: hypothetical protein JST73_05890 [Actinobacteria bacterium]|nr:hypothetical protein [Actinomycetota bacterium]
MDEVSPGKIVVLIGAGVAFAFSFLPWFSATFGGATQNAWQSGLLPMATWVPVSALVVGVIVAAQVFGIFEIPEKIWDFTTDQVVFVLAALALLLSFSYLIADKGGEKVGVGLILCFLGSVAMIAGCFMDRANVGMVPDRTTAGPSPVSTPTPTPTPTPPPTSPSVPESAPESTAASDPAPPTATATEPETESGTGAEEPTTLTEPGSASGSPPEETGPGLF